MATTGERFAWCVEIFTNGNGHEERKPDSGADIE
jgi:hypothetical protein